MSLIDDINAAEKASEELDNINGKILTKSWSLGEWRWRDKDGNIEKICLGKESGEIAIDTFIANFTAFNNIRRRTFEESLAEVNVILFRDRLLTMLESTENESKDLQESVKTCAADFIRIIFKGEK